MTAGVVLVIDDDRAALFLGVQPARLVPDVTSVARLGHRDIPRRRAHSVCGPSELIPVRVVEIAATDKTRLQPRLRDDHAFGVLPFRHFVAKDIDRLF